MHILFRESRDLEGDAPAEDLGHPPAELIALSFSDSDLGALAAAWQGAGDALPSLRLANLARLRHPLSVDLYLENTVAHARGVLVRALGGEGYWRYGLHQLHALARARGVALAVLPGDGRADPALDALSTLPVSTLRRLQALMDEGGAAAARSALGQMALAAGLWAAPAREAAALPQAGFYAPGRGVVCPLALRIEGPVALVAFYRSYLAAADLAPVDALAAALADRGLSAVCAFVPSLKAPEAAGWLAGWARRLAPAVVLNATAFAARAAGEPGPLEASGAPVLQVALSTADRAAWAASSRGLSPQDLAMHVALPEVDGRLFAGVVSFKQEAAADPALGFARRVHVAEPERVAAVADRAAGWARLAATPAAEKRLGLVLSTYPGREDRLAHAVGLDAPESAAGLLSDLATQGLAVAGAPADGAALISRLAAARLAWPLAEYRAALATLPSALRDALDAAWGPPEDDPDAGDGALWLRVLPLGNVALALQPERGRPETRAGEYHDQRRVPRHGYVAFHLWLRHAFTAHALIHLGAHGTLEWLPGKAVAQGPDCWPEALSGPLPVIYPFVVNDPGEAAMAKRRLGAVTVGHMTPPLRAAGVPEALRRVEALLDEYSNADGLDPARRDRLAADILSAAAAAGLDGDLPLGAPDALARLDAFVCDVKASQYADGLHVFGRARPGLPDGMPWEDCARAERHALAAALAGRAVQPGPAGSPWRGRRDVMPTGRNLYAVDPRATPSRAAAAQGARLADALLTRHLQDHGEWPRSVVVDLWGSAAMRTAGEEFAMALALMGVSPRWEDGSERVTGFVVEPLATLGRPRIDVTLRLSGLFRDVFEELPRLFEQAAAALAERDEAPEDNPYRAAAGPRAFGPAPGAYGVGLDPEATRAEAAEAWLASSAFAYGRDDGAPARAALEARVRDASAFVHPQDLPETDLLMADDYAAHEGGFAAAAAALGAAPALYHLDATRPDAPAARPLAEEVARVVRARAANPAWVAGMMRHGFRGAAEMAQTLDAMAAFATLADATGSHLFDLYFDATLGEPGVRDFLAAANPAALAAMRARFEALREAGLWTPRRNSVVAALAAE